MNLLGAVCRATGHKNNKRFVHSFIHSVFSVVQSYNPHSKMDILCCTVISVPLCIIFEGTSSVFSVVLSCHLDNYCSNVIINLSCIIFVAPSSRFSEIYNYCCAVIRYLTVSSSFSNNVFLLHSHPDSQVYNLCCTLIWILRIIIFAAPSSGFSGL